MVHGEHGLGLTLFPEADEINVQNNYKDLTSQTSCMQQLRKASVTNNLAESRCRVASLTLTPQQGEIRNREVH
jgi:hypothetical protein